MLKKKTVGILFTGILFLGVSLGSINLAAHPNMKNWIEKKLVITKVETKEKVVTLTFDDGPDPTNTPVVLQNLKKHNAKATFFVLGSRAEKYPLLLQEMVNNGHEIGNHSYSHANFNNKDNDFISNEIQKTNDIIYRITMQKPLLFRPPGGYLSYALVDNISQKEKVTIAYWTYQQDSKDWQGGSPESIANHIINNIQPGQIIILHDGCNNGLRTAQAVDIVLNKLCSQGYRFVTMSELIKLENK